MPALQAKCERCGTLFSSGAVFAEGSSGRAQFFGCIGGTCPKCGGIGRIPDGTYSVTDGLIRFFGSGEQAADRWYLLNELAQDAKASNWNAAQFRQNAEERSPGAAQLLNFLPESKSDWFSFLSMLITALALLQQFFGVTHTTPDAPLTQEQVAKAVTQGVLEASKQLEAAKQGAIPAQQSPSLQKRPFGRKVGRNDPCPCKSNKKYKRCCGIND